jgi:hypothetical protein
MTRGIPPVQVPVGEVVMAAYRSVFGHFGVALELGWLPLLILLSAFVLPDLALHYLVPPAATAAAPPSLGVDDLGQLVIGMFALSAFAVRWYQLMLLGDPRALPFRVSLRAWLRFAAYGLAILALWTGFYMAAARTSHAASEGADGVILVEAVVAALLFIGITRLSLLFPAAAHGVSLGLTAAWQAMSGNVWRLVGANILAILPLFFTNFLIVGAIVDLAFADPTEVTLAAAPLGYFLLSGLIEAVTGFVAVALIASIASEFYRRVMLPRD